MTVTGTDLMRQTIAEKPQQDKVTTRDHPVQCSVLLSSAGVHQCSGVRVHDIDGWEDGGGLPNTQL